MKLNRPNPASSHTTADLPEQSPTPDAAAGDSALLRIGAVAGITGLLLQVAMDQMHPAHAQPNDSNAAFTEYSHYGPWTGVHIGQFLGTLLLVIALLALARGLSRQRGLAGALAMLGAVTALILAAVFAVQMAVDGVALRSAIDTWTSAAAGPEKTSAFQVADALRGLEKGLSGFFHLNNGITLITLGLSIALGRLYARWLAGVAVLAGIAFLIGGVVTAQSGFSSDAGLVLTPALALLAVFIVGICVSMWRRAAV
jgi:lysylphosphatidylglycerol synthetase-like protein (DUF2156 family)